MRIPMLFAAALLACAPAHAQFRSFDLGKIIDTGKKLAEASKEYTTEEEIQLGEGITAAFLGAAPLHRDEKLQRYVNRVGRWVASHSERADLPWTFGVLDTQTINAFAMPGGTVVISYGLLKHLQSESELAGVLAHEVAHVVQKHQLKAIQSGAMGDVGGALLKEAADRSKFGRQTGGMFSEAAANLVKDGFFLRPLDRSLEYEADRMGVVLATRAGYDPYGFVAVLQMLVSLKPEDAGGAVLLSTHPSPTDRLVELEKVVPALEKYAGQQVDGRFRQTVGR